MATFKVGFELESFVRSADTDVIVPAHLVTTDVRSLDGCGLIAESRGEPALSALEAAYNILYAFDADSKKWPSTHYRDTNIASYKFTRKQYETARRSFTKDTIQYRNIDPRVVAQSDRTFAALHVSITRPWKVQYEYVPENRPRRTVNVTYEVNQLFDFLQVVRELDKAFATEIKEARRQPGFYELKPDGRFEYRSLPASVDIVAVGRKVDEILAGL